MAEDSRNYIEKTLAGSSEYSGRETTPAELASTFTMCDLDTRVSVLQSLHDEEYTTAEEAAKHHAHRRALRQTHERLRKIGR